ncbi:uncharacterized protein CTRU02_215704 [Colletotrichum truncatum]|uniref:Uncharacterized protein n=1 Tax=Colletotrichum truncatum TaxID=5467 RepID=A0ACC3YBW9_COLTU
MLVKWRDCFLDQLVPKTPGRKSPRRIRISWTVDERNILRGFLARHSHSPASLSPSDRFSCVGCTDENLRTVAASIDLDTTRITDAQWFGFRDRMLTHFAHQMSGWVNDGVVTQKFDADAGGFVFTWNEEIRIAWMNIAEKVPRLSVETSPGRTQSGEEVESKDRGALHSAPPTLTQARLHDEMQPNLVSESSSSPNSNDSSDSSGSSCSGSSACSDSSESANPTNHSVSDFAAVKSESLTQHIRATRRRMVDLAMQERGFRFPSLPRDTAPVTSQRDKDVEAILAGLVRDRVRLWAQLEEAVDKADVNAWRRSTRFLRHAFSRLLHEDGQ